MRLGHRVSTSATPAQVWQVLGTPARWPEFDLALRRVRGVSGPVAAGQLFVGVSRVGGIAVPIDVLEAEPGARLVLRHHTAPGVVATVTYEIVPVVRRGSDLRVSVVVEGLFARAAVAPLWAAAVVTTRLLAARTDRIARDARSVA